MDDPTRSPDALPHGTPSATRKSLQLGRRLVHAANGTVIASAYALLFTHEQVVHLFGTIACLVYVADRIRIGYPELLRRVPRVNTALFRAEEQMKESAMTPYAIAIFLTLLTFPKVAALVAIYTLALADPLSAVVGITWGRRRLAPDKTLEGSLAFFAATVSVVVAVLLCTGVAAPGTITLVALPIGLVAAAFELLPLRIDDNLTIPLFVGFTTWIVCAAAGVGL